MKKTNLIKPTLIFLLTALLLFPSILPDAFAYEPDYDLGNEQPIAQVGDISLKSAPIATDSASGTVKVRLYLTYKGSFRVDNLSILEIMPVVDDTENYPFAVTWSSYMLGVGDQKEDSPNDPKYGTVTTLPERYFEFEFQRKEDCLNGYYPISFKVRFLHAGQKIALNAPVEDTVTVYVQIKNGKDPETPTPTPTATPEPAAPTPKLQSKIILNRFDMNPADVVGGDTFDLTLVLENTHAKNVARNMRCTLTDPEGMVLPESGSSTFYVDKIDPGKTTEVTIRLTAMPEAGIKPVRMNLSLEYDDTHTADIKVEESFTLPIHQVIRLEYDDPYLPTQVYVDEFFDLSFNFRNTGKAAMYNTLVTLESETMRADASLYVGTMEGGSQRIFEPYVTISSDKLMYAVPAGGMESFETYEGEGMIDDMPTDEDLPPEGDPADDKPDENGAYGSLRFIGDYVSAKEPALYIGDDARVVVDMMTSVAPAYSSSSSGGSSGTSFAPGSMICSGIIVVTYEDNMGQQFRKEIPVQTSVMSFEQAYGPDPYMPYYDYETGYMIDPMTGEYLDPVTGLPVQRGLAPWIIISLIAAAVVVIVVAIILIRVGLKRKRKKLELAAENDMTDFRNGDA